ncbi:hypothetical protein SAMN06296036_108105 [Pseudobacteriovorax antillogorgiicola]|uniref:Uncharacterized protein n=2 Tax=Pseudobacteriovorax antillogorgiicola TaxID=1513793 RepID=A0A1Y6BRY4_9BACT|nr:hypothetical protein EDD56_108142 [Pseudobacteriovorax antillogorgiicola]SMF26029.1 hypothetical protein SAMN06296036_108105 [Pseudobacteriovorax antillogorgiicola]
MTEQQLIIRIANSGRQQDLIDILLTEDESQLPFSLPDLVTWPTGQRACSERAILLIRAGLRYLEAKQEQNPEVPRAKLKECEPSPQPQAVANPPSPEPQVMQPAVAPQTKPKSEVKAGRTDFDISLFQ